MLLALVTTTTFLATIAASICTLGYVCDTESRRIQGCKHRKA